MYTEHIRDRQVKNAKEHMRELKRMTFFKIPWTLFDPLVCLHPSVI
jgi:hypothetical protein